MTEPQIVAGRAGDVIEISTHPFSLEPYGVTVVAREQAYEAGHEISHDDSSVLPDEQTVRIIAGPATWPEFGRYDVQLRLDPAAGGKSLYSSIVSVVVRSSA